jgi:glycosyltransferase involved in cell wall biosynthesis
MNEPVVSAILTFSNPNRLQLTQKFVNKFILQHYYPYELIIVNGTDKRVLTNDSMSNDAASKPGCRIIEISVPAGLNAAAMKNRGILSATGDWVICLDNDDPMHESRIMYQMAHRKDNHVCLLKYQLRLDLEFNTESGAAKSFPINPRLHLLKMETGIPCTALFPRLRPDGEPWQFPEAHNTGEYELLLSEMQREGLGTVVCHNMHNSYLSGLHWPLLSVAVYHGGNELNRPEFFPTADKPTTQQEGINQTDLQYLMTLLKAFDFYVE